MNFNLYHVTMQVFSTQGPIMVNKYYELPKPFFPEDAKKKYMQENPGTVLSREHIYIISVTDQQENKFKLLRQQQEDAKMAQKIQEVTEAAGRGEYGEGPEAAKRAGADVRAVREKFNESAGEGEVPPEV